MKLGYPVTIQERATPYKTLRSKEYGHVNKVPKNELCSEIPWLYIFCILLLVDHPVESTKYCYVMLLTLNLVEFCMKISDTEDSAHL